MANKEEKIYPNGLVIFAPREGAPDFVKGSMIITPKIFLEWAKTMTEHFREYENNKQLSFDLLDGNKGLYAVLNTYKPNPSSAKSVVTESKEDDLPF
tara:strand:+ start:296 stop:586 length:291 start_codon:yes stop_codon:yes gene_type:complete